MCLKVIGFLWTTLCACVSVCVSYCVFVRIITLCACVSVFVSYCVFGRTTLCACVSVCVSYRAFVRVMNKSVNPFSARSDLYRLLCPCVNGSEASLLARLSISRSVGRFVDLS